MQILVIDDEQAHAIIAARAAEKSIPGCAITHSETSPDPSSISSAVRAIIVDFNLGDSTCEEFIRAARALARNRPIIVVSTSSLNDDVMHAYEAGASTFIYKSDDPGQYTAALSKALRYFLQIAS